MKMGPWFLAFWAFTLQFNTLRCCAQVRVEQKSFCEDSKPLSTLRAGSIPRGVMDAVMNTPEGKQARADAQEQKTKLSPENLLRGLNINLSPTSRGVFLVMGSYPLSAADGAWFWIVRQDRTRDSVLLWASGNCLDLKQSSSHGYRDIEVRWASSGSARTDFFRYGGTIYRRVYSHISAR